MTDSIQQAAYGSWNSPISAADVAAGGVRFGHLEASGHGVYWTETRPEEKGRSVLVRSVQDQCLDITDSNISVRSRVHEMGGSEFLVIDHRIVVCADSDQALYLLDGEKVEQLTPLLEADGQYRYTDMHYHPGTGALVAVRETHSEAGVINEIVKVSLDGQKNVSVLTSGFDFYSFPRISPNGSQLLWTCWNQPQMPWDGTELWLGDFDDGLLVNQRKICGGPEESIYQPMWADDDTMYFVSDRNGWWNVHAINAGRIRALGERTNDFGLPQWIFNTSTYAIVNEQTLVSRYQESDKQVLCTIDVESGKLTPLTSRFTYFGEYLRVADNNVYFFGASGSEPEALVEHDLASGNERIIKATAEANLAPELISLPEAIECDSGEEGDRKTFGFYYPPQNPSFEGIPDTLPPLVVMSHGGPTAAAHPVFNLAIQFWTSRGIAVLDVNYAGSTGYGREYRQALAGQWGIADVEDCISMAKFLVAKDRVDGDKLAIRGGSAGGYTTLCALTFHDVFAVGCSRYGVADLELLATDTHKFEARYLDQLVGDYQSEPEKYKERSPIHFLDKLSCPVILMQGLKDKIVPSSQAEAMVAALEQKQLAYAYVTFPEEAHGFRQADNIIRALEAEYDFYGQILGFATDSVDYHVTIKNLAGAEWDK